MAFIPRYKLEQIGFKKLGKNVSISDKASLYNVDQIEIGDNSRIDDFCMVSGNVKIGRNVHVTAFCNIAGGEPGVIISDFSTLAYGCHVFSQSDDYSGESMTNSTIPKKYKCEKFESVLIGKNVIVGARSVILPGCNIADGCSIGAMSLITRPTSPWGIYFGIPARRVKERKMDLLQFETEYLKEESNDTI
ncbi:MAG: acyltransferase [Gammaproteobacteria bacterium]|nr:acyltransferase [Gammaproteobacteria bacterium]